MKIDKKIIVNALIALVVYAAVMGLVKGGVLSRQMMSLITPVCVYVMMSVSLSLVVGFLGELSLGHAAFMSIGAYTGCLFLIATKDILPVLVSLLLAVFIGGVAAALLGVVIGIPVLRLKGDYLAIVTLGFGEIIKSVFNSLKITGGAKGLSKIPLVATYKNFTFVFIPVSYTHLDVYKRQECEDAKAVADAMKATGWEFASHTWGHINVGQKSLEGIQTDTEKWLNYVSPLVGGTDVIIFAFGADLGDWTGYTTDNEKFNYLKSQGFDIYCNVDSTQYWVQFGSNVTNGGQYMRQGRRNLDGYRMHYNPEMVEDLFDAKAVFDPARPTPVPPM